MPSYVELSRYRKSQLRSKIILTPTAVAPLPFTAVPVVKGQSGIQDPGPRAGPPGAGSCCPTLNAKEQCFNPGFRPLAGSRLGVRNKMGESGSGLGPTFKAN